VIQKILPAPQSFRPPAVDLNGRSTTELDAILDSIQIVDDPIKESLVEAIRQKQIIGLRESFSVYEERYPKNFDSPPPRGGDWEYLVDYSLVDVLRTGRDSIAGSLAGSAFTLALRKQKNREEAKEIWTVALEQRHAPLLAAWWNMSADDIVRRDNADPLDGEAENRPAPVSDRARPRRSKRTTSSPKYKKIHEMLQEIAKSRPSTQEEVFQALDARHVATPDAEPFVAARGWIAGFRQAPPSARAWLSKRWATLDLPPLPRGPKNTKK
jgi:hypothetical protein